MAFCQVFSRFGQGFERLKAQYALAARAEDVQRYIGLVPLIVGVFQLCFGPWTEEYELSAALAADIRPNK